MVVTASREAALKYYRGMQRYLSSNSYEDLGVLVAFSGALPDGTGGEITEAELNGFAETELPKKFDGADYHLLIVAEKYQTGFDQPKLCAMYVDRKLAGLQAVQTLSRLNRTKRGKERTYILDFQNSIEDIKEAFKPFFETTTLEERSDPIRSTSLSRRSSVTASSTGQRWTASQTSSSSLVEPLRLIAQHLRQSFAMRWTAGVLRLRKDGARSFGSCSRATNASTSSSLRS
ncbi:MAG: type I restriction endonuclease subunit R [Oceanicaulis sp.]|nr:type I restriction endonuclease subunit R [Oceanicaulis sp.]